MTTQEITHSIADGRPVHINRDLVPLTVGTMPIRATSSIILLSPQHRVQAECIIRRSLDAYEITEATRAGEAIGRPTLLARLDTTIGPEGLLPFECEERPAGLGVIDLLTRRADGIGVRDQLHAHVSAITEHALIAVHTPDTDNDDAAVMDVCSTEDVSHGSSSTIVRVGAEDNIDVSRQRELAAVSISTVGDEGNKRYMQAVREFGVELVTSSQDLPEPGISFVLKALHGSRSRGVYACLNAADKKLFGKQRTVTRSKAECLANKLGGATVESIKPPVPVLGLGNMIFRILATVSADRVHVIGGAFCIQRDMVVTGSQAASGAIICA